MSVSESAPRSTTRANKAKTVPSLPPRDGRLEGVRERNTTAKSGKALQVQCFWNHLVRFLDFLVKCLDYLVMCLDSIGNVFWIFLAMLLDFFFRSCFLDFLVMFLDFFGRPTWTGPTILRLR